MSFPYSNDYNNRRTPQSQAIPGRESEMARNNQGGFSFLIDHWAQLNRFLILGSEGGIYYATQQKLTLDNVSALKKCVEEDGKRTVDTIVSISMAGRAAKNSPAIFALAYCSKQGNLATRQHAYSVLNAVCRTPTHLFEYIEYVRGLGCIASGTKRAIQRWYYEQGADSLAYKMVKYQQRNGWSHRDVLRLIKPSKHEPGSAHDQLFGWATKGWSEVPKDAPNDLLQIVWAFERAKQIGRKPITRAGTAELVALINEHSLPRECIPTNYLNEPDIWAALLDNGGRGMPITALIRNLPKLTLVGLLTPNSEYEMAVRARLENEEVLHRGRVHPLNLLIAQRTYAKGRGVRGSLAWNPNRRIIDSLDSAFYKSFGNVQSSGKRMYLALDLSASMTWTNCAGMPITPREASAAMALVTANSESNYLITGFTADSNAYGYGYNSVMRDLDLSPRMRLDEVVRYVEHQYAGGTDCSLPMRDALNRKIPVDTFVIYTDNDTRHGSIHPIQALKSYRQGMGIDAKLVVVGMTSTGFSIADPKDRGCLDLVGFDTAAPNVISQFSAGIL